MTALRKFKPHTPYTTAIKLIKPTEAVVRGVVQKTDPPLADCPTFFCDFRSYGGSENWNNDILTVADTAKVETWYNPAFTTDCKIYVCQTGETYEIISPPENIDMRNQFMQFKVEKIGGKP